MKIRIAKSTSYVIGMLRVSKEVWDKVSLLSKKNGVSKQEVIRAILDQVINDIEV